MNDIMNIEGIECYEKDGVAYLKLETVARGLGFTDNGKAYRWLNIARQMKFDGLKSLQGRQIFTRT